MPDLTDVFAALADPGRRAILERLLEGEATVAELTDITGLAQPTVSKHIKVLRATGLIASRIDGNRRPSVLVPGALAEVEHWLDRFADASDPAGDRLDDLLAEFLDPPQQA